MDGEMGSMMAWMMGFGLLGWLVVIGLLIAILVVLVRILNRNGSDERSASAPPRQGPGETRR